MTTATLKVDRAAVMKNAWQIFREKAVRTMKAWSDALRSAWKIVKGGTVAANDEKRISIRDEVFESAKRLKQRQSFKYKNMIIQLSSSSKDHFGDVLRPLYFATGRDGFYASSKTALGIAIKVSYHLAK